MVTAKPVVACNVELFIQMIMAYFAPNLPLWHLFFRWKERGKQEALI